MKSRVFSALLSLYFVTTAYAQQDRVPGAVTSTRMRQLTGSLAPLALPQFDQGPADQNQDLPNLTLLFKPSAAQQADLDQTLEDLQNPASPSFRKWLTPEEYADRFGVSPHDADAAVAWLKGEGFTVTQVARGRGWIRFSGTAGRAGAALRTQIRSYRVNGQLRYANSTEPSVPEALSEIVAGIRGLDDFKLTSHHRIVPSFNLTSGRHALAPDDLSKIYDLDPLFQVGIDGSGQKLAIIGQTDIAILDVQTFRQRFGLPVNDPLIVPAGSGAVPGILEDELPEADLDLEWSGAVARKATILFVTSSDVVTSAAYAIDNNVAPVMSMSYGGCEQRISTGLALRTLAQQAAAQGITWLVSAGDAGAAGCDFQDTAPQTARGLGVSIFAAFPEVTGVGGTMFDDATGSYWANTNGTTLASAKSYIPEKGWNENDAAGLFSGGGGASILFSKPEWQSGPGVPNDQARDVPDISLAAADHTPYSINTGGSVVNVSGSSASAPAMAGIITLLNQYLLANGNIKQPGLGNINPTLYRMAQTVPSAFHDIATGDNMTPCVQSSLDCVNGQLGYSAGPGYDQVTGLGSIDGFLLIGNWASATGIPTSLSLTTDTNSVDLNGSVKLTATVTGSASGTLSGTVSFGVSQSSAVLGSATLVASGSTGVATLTIPANLLAVGSKTIYATFSGNATFNASAGTAQLTVTNPGVGVSAVALVISPAPVFLKTKDPSGAGWSFTLQVRELAGVATTLTGFSANGTSLPLLSFFSRSSLSAKGTLSSTIAYTGTDPSRIYTVTGQDTSGRTWQQSVTATFVNKQDSNSPSMALLSATGSIQQDASNSSCPWSQTVFLQEQSGYSVFLEDFFVGNDDRSDQIQQIFGTTRLAPLGVLTGRICWSATTLPPTDSYFVDGLADSGTFISSTLAASFSAAGASTAHASVAPAAIATQVADASQTASATLSLTFDSGTLAWTASVFPNTRTTSWLQLATKSGSGPAQLAITTNPAGLSNGVYNATILIRSTNATPQYISVPVSLTVGASSSITVGGVSNAFSGVISASPGMLVSVYGSGLAPAIQHAPSVPLALSMQNVSATVNGISAPVLDILPGQLNIQIPYETTAGPAVLGINNNGQVASFPIVVTAAAPGQWPHFLDGTTGQVVTSAKRGAVLLTFITGEGQVSPDVPNGAAPPLTFDASELPTPLLPLSVSVGGDNATVLFGGIPNYLTGVTQVNFTVPADAPLGPQMVVISVGGVNGNPVPLTITQ